MFDLIEKKAQELKSSMPDNPQLRKWIDQSNLWYWLHADMNRQGIKVGRRQVADVLAGTLLEDTPMNVYGYIHAFAGIYRDMKNYVVMKSSLTGEMLDGWYQELFYKENENGDPLPAHRQTTSAIYEWGYIPPHFRDVSRLLDELLRRLTKERYAGNFLDRAVEIYTGILRIYPYGENTPAMAGIALIYCLLEEGLPIPGLQVNEQEYNTIMAEYFEKGDASPVKNLISRAVYNRLDAVLQIALEAAESELKE